MQEDPCVQLSLSGVQVFQVLKGIAAQGESVQLCLCAIVSLILTTVPPCHSVIDDVQLATYIFIFVHVKSVPPC